MAGNNGKAVVRRYDLEDRLIAFGVLACQVADSLPSGRLGNHIAGQLFRCGTAPAAIYGEAQSAESRKDFIHKMKLCLKELRETNVWLKFIAGAELGDGTTREDAVQECHELISIFAKSILTARRNDRGSS